jgi:hypothetical protein
MWKRNWIAFCGIAGALALVGCGDGASTTGDETEPPTTGTVVLRFSMPDDVRMNSNLVDPLLGNVYGNLYLREDVGVAGPHDGIKEITNVEVEKVDIRMTNPSVETWQSGPLEPQDYSFLGMLDVDGNSEETDRGPDAGDPVMLGTTNHFEIVAGEETEAIIVFNLIYN